MIYAHEVNALAAVVAFIGLKCGDAGTCAARDIE
jgi:hypothetical protein